MPKPIKMKLDWNPQNRAFTGGVGKPIKERSNDGRSEPPSKMGLGYAASGASPTRVRSSALCRTSGIYGKLEPYARSEEVTRVVIRAPKHLSEKERKRWHKLKKAGIL